MNESMERPYNKHYGFISRKVVESIQNHSLFSELKRLDELSSQLFSQVLGPTTGERATVNVSEHAARVAKLKKEILKDTGIEESDLLRVLAGQYNFKPNT